MDRAVRSAALVGMVHGALNRCEGADGRIARRNARARVLAALRAVRSHLDKEYPEIRAPRRQVSGKTARQRATLALRRLHEAGWKSTWDMSSQDLGMFAAAGVPIKRVGLQGNNQLLVPGWAVAIGAVNQAQLRAAKKSKELRDAALARAALLQGT